MLADGFVQFQIICPYAFIFGTKAFNFGNHFLDVLIDCAAAVNQHPSAEVVLKVLKVKHLPSPSALRPNPAPVASA